MPSSILTLAMGGVPYGPVVVAGTNANQTLPAAILSNNSRSAIRVVITCETNPIRYAFGGIIPTSGASGTGHILAANESLVIGHPGGITTFRFINHTANSNAALQITGEYAA